MTTKQSQAFSSDSSPAQSSKRTFLTVHAFGFLLVLALLFLDQLTKRLAVVYLKDGAISLIDNILCLSYLENKGIGFGLFQGKLLLILLFNLLIVGVIVWIIFRLPMNRRLMPVRISLLFIVAGAFGNIIDRVMLGYVVDFIYLECIDFPVFNVADIYVTVSVICFALLYLFYCKPGELEDAIFPKK